jgi:hypothetical protein
MQFMRGRKADVVVGLLQSRIVEKTNDEIEIEIFHSNE